MRRLKWSFSSLGHDWKPALPERFQDQNASQNQGQALGQFATQLSFLWVLIFLQLMKRTILDELNYLKVCTLATQPNPTCLPFNFYKDFQSSITPLLLQVLTRTQGFYTHYFISDSNRDITHIVAKFVTAPVKIRQQLT